MIKRTAPVLIPPAAGLEKYHNYADPKDLAEYRAILATSNLRDDKLPDNVTETWITPGGVRAAKLTVDGGDHSHLLLHIHGGGFNGGSPCTKQQAMIDIQQQVGMDLISLDYGLAPEHPYPDGLMDCVSAYQALIQEYDPEKIVLIGESAGGTYCLTVPMYLRDHDIPLPGGLFLISPNLQLPDPKALRADYEKHPGNLKDLEFVQLYEMYMGAHPYDDPYLSPKYGKFEGLPPMFIQCGSSEQMSSTLDLTAQAVECATLAAKANVDVQIHVWQYMAHVFLFNVGILPEADAAVQEVAQFLRRIYNG